MFDSAYHGQKADLAYGQLLAACSGNLHGGAFINSNQGMFSQFLHSIVFWLVYQTQPSNADKQQALLDT